jgi:hypothetical protein
MLMLGGVLDIHVSKIFFTAILDFIIKIICLKYINENDFYGIINDSFKNWKSNDFVETIDCFYYSAHKIIRALNTNNDYIVCRIEMLDLSPTNPQRTYWRYLNNTVDQIRSTLYQKLVVQVAPFDFSESRDIKVFSVKNTMINKVD